MNLLTLGAEHQLIGVTASSRLLGRRRFHFLPAIGAAIPDDTHGKVSFRSSKREKCISRVKVHSGRVTSRLCVILSPFLLLDPDYFDQLTYAPGR
jgi:hypothetical protein